MKIGSRLEKNMFEENYPEDDGGEEIEDFDQEDESETAESRDELEQRLYRYRSFLLIIIAFDAHKISLISCQITLPVYVFDSCNLWNVSLQFNSLRQR